MEQFGKHDRPFPPGDATRSSDAFTTGVFRGACGSVAAGIAFVVWGTTVEAVDVSFMWGGLVFAAAAFVACGFVTASAAGCRRGWAGMLCGAVLPALAVGLLLASQTPYSLADSLIAVLMLPVAALAGSLVLGSFGFALRIFVWPAGGRLRRGPLLVACMAVVFALVAVGSVTGYFRWGGLFRSCPTGRSCVYELGISMVVPPGWHVESPSGDSLWVMAWDEYPKQVGVMAKRGSSVLSDTPLLPTTLDQLEMAAMVQTSRANAILMGNTTATPTRVTLPVGQATCLRYERWMFLVDWSPEVTDCWFFVDGRIALVSAVDAPNDYLDAFLQSIRALPDDG